MAGKKANPHLWVGGCTMLFAFGMGCVPMYFKWLHGGKGLQNKETGLTGSQRQRGMYVQAGSHDVGPDPAWVRGVYQYPSRAKSAPSEQEDEAKKK